MKKLAFGLLIIVLIANCQNDSNRPDDLVDKEVEKPSVPLFEQVLPEYSGINFVNEVIENDELNYFSYFHLYIGGGVAAGDLNNDGLPDLYFNGNLKGSKLYINQGDLKFSDQTANSNIRQTPGFTTGVSMIDINNDGWLDIYICKTGFAANPEANANLLYINDGNAAQNGNIPTFTERAESYGLNSKNNSIQASFFDYDKDGDLDMYLMNTPEDFSLTSQVFKMDEVHNNPDFRKYQGYDQLFRNDNDKFTEVTEEAGILSDIGFGLGILTVDVNNDGWTDIFVGNDFLTPDYLYINQKNGTFQEKSKEFFRHTSFYSMGMDIADLNKDGLMDIFVLDMLPEDYKRSKITMEMVQPHVFGQAVAWGYNYQYMHNNLHINNGNGSFSEIAQMAGVAKSDWSWSAIFGDFDLDAHADLYITNGIQKDITERDFKNKIKKRQEELGRKLNFTEIQDLIPSEKLSNYLYRNDGELHFTNVAAEWGTGTPGFSNGAVSVDLDNDGDLELVTNNVNDPAFLYRNKSNELGGNYLKIKLKGNKQLNPQNSLIVLKNQQDEVLQSWEMITTRGYMSCGEAMAHFGLGQLSVIPKVEIQWADGKVSQLKEVKSNQLLVIEYDNSNPSEPKKENYQTIFTEKTSTAFLPVFTHTENNYDDFLIQKLLPHRQSQNGPSIAVGDVNNDGLEDFYIGGAHTQPGALYRQNSNGEFVAQNVADFVADRNFEDMGCVFIDIDKDGDLDLYVVSGGYEFSEMSAYQDRMYFNDGQGNFTKNMSPMCVTASSGSCVQAADFDKDGDLDLFVGGRVLPNRYPYPARSYLLRNENGKFVDATAETAQELAEIGMVTSAVWTDFNKDGRTDLIVVGEWMNIEFFENSGKQLVRKTEEYGFGDTRGWWNQIIETDIDQDGDADYIAGNLGLNYKFQASSKKPLKIYCDDFDENGTFDIVLAKNVDNVVVPVRGRSCSSEQMPFIKDKFPTFGSFADADLGDIYGDENLNAALNYEATLFESVLLRNNNGQFTVEKLPKSAQISPINGIIVEDFNKDGQLDLLIAGNHFGAEVETTRADAGIGLLLEGKSEGFAAVPVARSGFYTPNDVKALKKIKMADGSIAILVINNNSELQIFK